MGTVGRLGTMASNPSTADATDMGGVIIPSANNVVAPSIAGITNLYFSFLIFHFIWCLFLFTTIAVIKGDSLGQFIILGVNKPRIGVPGLNPHADNEGLIGTEEESIIIPAIKKAKNNSMLVVGQYSADTFFARRSFNKFNTVLVMYHDQGLIPFKSLPSVKG